jgi:uncharacterized sulfatase
VDEHLSINGSPSKQAVVEHHGSEPGKRLFQLAFGKRAEEELYDLKRDPWQTNNVAADPAYNNERARLKAKLQAQLLERKDPRAVGKGDVFDSYYYVTSEPSLTGKPKATPQPRPVPLP